ncbi:MAG: hypothetical protein M1528_01045 [Candidatus Marsarchaeota archaeon]|jgi:oligoribonuclease NrnB/cAMP/cGMP phosphodiesterase (DHH superfamily)|nr:hypothetical protein [Candidatus Marsarchaeota archaeon]MCL5115105.1 hypothetical protein [Candidatus Marsarchaeota archaeon]
MIYNVTHARDLDGMASAALITRNYKIPLENIIFFDYGDSFSDITEEIAAKHPQKSVFVFSDVGVNRDLLGEYVKLLPRLAKRGNKVIWLDHHQWSNAEINRISRYCSLMVVGENRYYCGSDIVYKILCKKDAESDKVAELAHTSDMFLKPKSRAQMTMLKRYAFGLKYYNLKPRGRRDKLLREVVLNLSQGIISNKPINQGYAKYRRIFANAQRRLDKSSRLLILSDNTRIALGFSNSLQSTFAGIHLLKKFKADISAYINTGDRSSSSANCSMRSRKGGLDCLKIALKFNGGGHPQACAFRITKGYDFSRKADRERFVREFARVAEEAYG